MPGSVGSLLSRFDGRTTIGELLDAYGMSGEDAMDALTELFDEGVVEAASPSAASAARLAGG